MRTLPKILAPVVTSLALIGALSGCGSSTTASTTAGSPVAPVASPATPATDTPAVSNSNSVTITGFAFSPATVKAGQHVTVTNADSVPHTLTIASTGLDVKVPANGTASFTAPAKAGSYALTCDFHPSMSGTLTVTS